MRWRLHSRRFRGAVALTAALTAIGLVLASQAEFAAARPKPPKPKPVQRVTRAQVNAAASAKQVMAQQVGALSAQVAEAQIELQQAQSKVDLAEQRYALAHSQRIAATQAAATAQADLRGAQAQVTKARADFVAYVRATYMSGNLDGTVGNLLTAPDPNALLQQSALQAYQQQNKATAIGALQTATVARSNAEAKAQRLLLAKKQAEAVEEQRRQAAQAAYVAAQQQEASLQATMAVKQRELDTAKARLIQATQGRAQYLNYLNQKRTYDAWVAWKKRQDELARQRRLAAQRQHSGAGSPGSWHSGPSAPPGGSWTPSKGRRAAYRALSQLNMPYIWAAGDKYGPTTGGCTDPIAPCGTVGYDCSGLVLYAWGADWAHFAATQYSQAGSYHPSPGNFEPGDLLFWTGGEGIISHVAIYIGNNNVVQAPQSGDVVKITPWYAVESGYYGATRPLT